MTDEPEEEILEGGNVSPPSRIGGNVHRPAGEWSPTIHALLRHLERVGFKGAPRVVGFDDSGREVLTYIEGDAGSAQFPQALLHERGLIAYGRFLRSYHDAVASFVPQPDAVYRIGPRALGSGEVVCHGDPGFWNVVWRGDEIVALIDWDFAEPGPPIYDLAAAAMPILPMRPDESAERMGLPSPPDRRGRLAALCAGYGDVTPAEVMDAAAESMAREIERLNTFGAGGREPWATFVKGGQLELFENVAAWIDEHRAALV